MTFQATEQQTNGKIAQLNKGDTVEIKRFRAKLEQLCATPEPKALLMTITPLMARVMLDKNVEHNRPIGERRVNYQSSEMKSGRWALTNQGIGFDKKGRLIDGQHRLVSCIDTETSFQSFVMFGLDEEVFMKVDQGSSRSAGDLLHIKGESYANMLGAAVRFVWAYQNGTFGARSSGGGLGGPSGGRMPPELLFKTLKHNPLLRDFCPLAFRLYEQGGKANQRVLGPSLCAALYYLCSRKDHVLADGFFSQLMTGIDLKATSPVFKLRNKLLEHGPGEARLPFIVKAAFVIKAWNANRTNTSLRYISWTKRESFPEIK